MSGPESLKISVPETDPSLLAGLARVVGEPNRSGRALDRLIYSRDVWPKAYLWLREKNLPHVPLAVVWPRSEEEVSGLIKWAREQKVPITPAGGGSGVCGGSVPVRGGVVMDLKRMNRVIEINEFNHTVDAQAGIMGETLERRLNRRGLTLGHFPASIYCSTLGGWLSARSAGQLSSKYGKIEDMALSLTGVLADGSVFHSKDSPRSATGPNLDQLIIGSEGTLAVITRALLTVRPLPEWREYRGFLCGDMEAGVEAMRLVMREGLDPSVTRLYDELDTRLHAKSLGAGGPGCLLIMGFEGPDNALTRAKATRGFEVCGRHGKDLGIDPGEAWLARRYSVSFYQSTILSQGNTILDTCEMAVKWSGLLDLYHRVRDAIARRAMVTAHVSHIYPTGAAIYFTFVAGSQDPPASEVYQKAWEAAMEACLASGGTISHHHGIGAHKSGWMRAELGPALDVFRALKAGLDPDNVLNPGKLGMD